MRPATLCIRNHDGVIARMAMLLAAAAAIAAAVAWLHDARTFASAQSAALAARTPAELERAAVKFDRVGTLTPDTLAKSAEAYTLMSAKRWDRGAALLEGVVRREPRNLRAWAGLYIADRGRNPARAAYALARARRLGPPVK
jgi:phosphotransferase system HPr-like phosphotransfer protein